MIAGVSHGGTTSLFTYLAAHPEICSSKIKETHYFYPIMAGTSLPPLHEYQKYFRHCGNQRYVMEAGPGYLYGGRELALLIRKILGDVKLIFILREPVSMLYAYFKYNHKVMQLEEVSFGDFVKKAFARLHDTSLSKLEKTQDCMSLALEGGFYAKYLEEWYTVFGDSLIKVVFFDDLKDRPRELMEGLSNWLNIDSDCYDAGKFMAENRGFYFRNKAFHRVACGINTKFEFFFRQYPAIKRLLMRLYVLNIQENPFALDGETKILLEKFYAPYNKELYALLQEKGYRHNIPSWAASADHEYQAQES
ncbi:MAG: hypothetical protein BWK76_09325 [Desulfobulbaceae bacterium A2]|nr:MAG: hypothetical protein BWK76_09325 [Desulfobulbaceae bacterium A2]